MFKQRETLTQNITYMAMMAAINVIFVLISFFVPYLVFLLVFVLPLTSAIVTLFCKKKYFLIYALATIGLCMLTTMRDFSDTLFYVIPSIISGFLFGIMIEKKVPAVWIIILCSIVTMGFTYAFIPLIDAIYHQNIVYVFAKLFGLQDYKYLDNVVPCVIFLIALAQIVITYLVIKIEVPKLGFRINENYDKSPLIGAIITAFILVIAIFVAPKITILITIFEMYFIVLIILKLIERKNPWFIAGLVVSLVISILMFAFLYKYVSEPLGVVLLNIGFALIILIELFDCYFYKNSNDIM